MRTLGSWAGEPIVCVGDYLDNADIPESLREHLDIASDEGYSDIYDWASETFQHVGSGDIIQCLKKEARFTSSVFILSIASQRKEMRRWFNFDLYSLMCPRMDQFYDIDKEWVLRNLTTREYVKASAIALDPKEIKGPEHRYIGFGEVLVMRITCSSPGTDCSMRYDITQGAWAGHCFDIKTIDSVEGGDSEEWIDISDGIVKQIDELWTSEYGENWKEKLMMNVKKRHYELLCNN